MFLIKEVGGVCGTFITGFISCYLLFDTLFLGLGFIGGIFGVVGSFLIISLIKSYPIMYTIVKYYSIVAVALFALNIIYKQIKYR